MYAEFATREQISIRPVTAKYTILGRTPLNFPGHPLRRPQEWEIFSFPRRLQLQRRSIAFELLRQANIPACCKGRVP